MTDRLFGAIEAGGTKFVCAIGTSARPLLAEGRFSTRDPQATLADAIQFFKDGEARFGRLAGLGIGTFGPVQLDANKPDYGHILHTPKAGWQGADMRGALARALDLPVAIDTDVNCALRAEAVQGAGRGCSNLVYLTIGTGIGGAFMLGGRILGGETHAEIGHLVLPKLADDAAFRGVCPYHGDRCAEGLASGPALQARVEGKLTTCADDHPIWSIAARYLAMLCGDLMLTLAPERIIAGGGVMSRTALHAAIEAQIGALFKDYPSVATLRGRRQAYLVPPALEGRAGVLGALMLAEQSAIDAPAPATTR
jgi:fructokinase